MTALGCLAPFVLMIAGAALGAGLGGAHGGLIGLIAGFLAGIVLAAAFLWILARLEHR